MNKEAKEAFARLEKKVDKAHKINCEGLSKISDFEAFENDFLKVVDSRLHEIRTLVYVVLLLIAVLVSLMIGVLLKTLVG